MPNVSRPQNTCYKCDKRVPGCHSTCEEYAAFAAKKRLEYDERKRYSAGTRPRWRKDLAAQNHQKSPRW